MLPVYKDSDNAFQMMQSRWASILNPVLSNPLTNANMLTDVNLTTGVNKVNHKLGFKPQGFIISDINASAIVYRSDDFNDKTLTLTTNADCTVSLVVF